MASDTPGKQKEEKATVAAKAAVDSAKVEATAPAPQAKTAAKMTPEVPASKSDQLEAAVKRMKAMADKE